MKKSFLLGFILIISSVFIACSSPVLEDYRKQAPALDVRAFFSGDLLAYGIVRDRSGKVIRYFKAVLKGSWDDKGVGTLDEVFWFNDGERQTRLWTMVPREGGGYTGTAGDVEGSANIQASGNAMRLSYKLVVPYNDSDIVLSMDDWMYQVVPGVVINETTMNKWGFEVGKITLAIIKADMVDTLPALIDQFESK